MDNSDQQPEIISDHVRRPGAKKKQWRVWILTGASVFALVAALTLPLWFEGVVRRVIPDRYLVAYAPEFIKPLIFDTDPSQAVPTVIPDGDNDTALDLLAVTPSIVYISPTPPPTVQSAGSSSGQIPATPTSSGPQPTPTSAFISEEEQNQPTPIPESQLLEGFTYTPQGWNRCGPATMSMYLSYWGLEVTQNDVMNAVKPHEEDSNASPYELAAYAESLGYKSIYRINGSVDQLKAFLAAGYPVMIERGFDEMPEEGWMGHYMLIIGFADEDQKLIALDSYWGWRSSNADKSTYWNYDEFDRLWRHFNRTYIVVYPPDQAAEVGTILGEDADDITMYVNALQRTTNELRLTPDDFWGWNNLGNIYTGLGEYESATEAFDKARGTGLLPWRLLWYQFDMYEAYYQVGRYEDVLTLANNVLYYNNYPESEEALYYRGLVYQAQGQIRAARREFTQALRYNPHYQPALDALESLEDDQ